MVAACEWNQPGCRVQQLVQLRATPGALKLLVIFATFLTPSTALQNDV